MTGYDKWKEHMNALMGEQVEVIPSRDLETSRGGYCIPSMMRARFAWKMT